MDIQDLVQTGKDMLNEVSDAVVKGNYTHLSDSLKELTERMYEQQARAAREREKQMKKAARQPSGKEPSASAQGGAVPAGKASAPAGAASGRETPSTGKKKNYFLQKPVSRMTGILSQIFGFIGGIACIPFLIAALVLMSAFDGLFVGFLLTAIIMGFLEGVCVYAITRGKRYRKLIRDYYRYGKAVGTREYIGLRELAGLVTESTDTVHLRLSQMMRRGLLPQARFDASETTLMLTDSVYEQYQKIQEERCRTDEQDNTREWGTDTEKDSLSPQVQKILWEGDDYIAFVHRCNDEIPGEDMSDKLYKLEDITGRIFAQVRKDPSSADSLQKFLDYYLPMTRKLLSAYVELEHQPDAGENITETRREIESAIDTINDAFERLLDSMFEDMAWDVSSDISAMKTMLAQDGLTESGKH